MMDYINETIGEFPKKVLEALHHMTIENTHDKIFKFVIFCKSMRKRIGEELEDLQRKKPRR